jgi:hypothetical protein
MMVFSKNQMDYLLRGKSKTRYILQQDSPLPNVGMYMMSFVEMKEIKKQV